MSPKTRNGKAAANPRTTGSRKIGVSRRGIARQAKMVVLSDDGSGLAEPPTDLHPQACGTVRRRFWHRTYIL
jgi:hypothetical protein